MTKQESINFEAMEAPEKFQFMLENLFGGNHEACLSALVLQMSYKEIEESVEYIFRMDGFNIVEGEGEEEDEEEDEEEENE